MSLFASVVPHFLKNDPSWALNQTSSPTHTNRGTHTRYTLLSQTHAQIRITRVTDGVQGQRDAVFVMCVTDLQYVPGIRNSLRGRVRGM